MLYMEIMALAGNIDPAIVSEQKAIIQAYLMNLEFGRRNKEEDDEDDDDAISEDDNEVEDAVTLSSFDNADDESVFFVDSEDYQKLHMRMRAARLHVVPMGYFWKTPKKLMPTSRPLKVHYCVAILIYEEIGEENFRLLLI